MSAVGSSSPFVRGIPLIGGWLDRSLFGPPSVRDSTPGMMALVFGLSPHHPDYKKGLLGMVRSSPVGKAFNALFLIVVYVLILYLPFATIYQANRAYMTDANEALPTAAAQCKWSFPGRCGPADLCKKQGNQCVSIQ